MASTTVLSLPVQMQAWLFGKGDSRSLFDHVYYMITIVLDLINLVLQVRTLLRLRPIARTSPHRGRGLLGLVNIKVVQRPESKQEYKSRMSERDTLLWWPVAVSSSPHLTLRGHVKGSYC